MLFLGIHNIKNVAANYLLATYSATGRMVASGTRGLLFESGNCHFLEYQCSANCIKNNERNKDATSGRVKDAQ